MCTTAVILALFCSIVTATKDHAVIAKTAPRNLRRESLFTLDGLRDDAIHNEIEHVSAYNDDVDKDESWAFTYYDDDDEYYLENEEIKERYGYGFAH